MAWIESHQSLGTHRKLMRLCSLARVDDARAIGMLHLLWWWALDNAPNGDITGVSEKELAMASHWKGKPEIWMASLCQAGWLDNENGRLVLHDWYDYAGKLVSKRQQNAERMRQARATHVQRTCNACAGATGPNTTGPNRTITTTPTPSSPDNGLSSLSSAEEINIFKTYESEIGPLTPHISEKLKAAEIEFTPKKVNDAINEASRANRKSWRYVSGILDNWRNGKQKSVPYDDPDHDDPDRFIKGKYGHLVRRGPLPKEESP